jgi:phosphatidylserine decarboxylase
MQKVKEWLNSPEVNRLKKVPIRQMLEKEFFRDPMRPIYHDKNCFYTPADGTILYAYPNIGPKEKIVEVKGRNFTVRELLNDNEYNVNSLVVGIFMSFFDVHINKMPTDGYIVCEEPTPSIWTHKSSMLAVEYDLFDEFKIDPNNMEYLFENERKILTVYCPYLEEDYYIVQIADREVDVIANWGVKEYMSQGERFGIVRYGSQVDVVIPLTKELLKEYSFNIPVKRLDHVQSPIDTIVNFKRKK